MKKIVSLKEIMILLISVTIIAFLTNVVFALDMGDPIDPTDYENAQNPDVGPNLYNNILNTNNSNINNTNINNTNINNTNINNTNINISNTNNNTVKKYNTNSKDLPQTGIEDYNIGILLIICIGSAIYAYKKVSDYRSL